MAYFMIKPGEKVTALDYIKQIARIDNVTLPSPEEVKALEIGEVVEINSRLLDYTAACKLTGSIAQAQGDVHQRIVVFSYERTTTLHKAASSTNPSMLGWQYGAGFRLIVNHMTAKASAAMTLSAIAAEASVGLNSTTILVQSYGANALMPAYPDGHTGFSAFNVDKLTTLEGWVDAARKSIGDGWADKTPTEIDKIITNTRPLLTGIEISTTGKSCFDSIDPLTQFVLWRCYYGDSLERTLDHMKNGSGAGMKKARDYPDLINPDTVKALYRSLYAQYGGLPGHEVEKLQGNEAYLKSMSMPEALRAQAKDFLEGFRQMT
ncbi:hypothetical protein G3435_22850 [Pseudomonas sp. MAFF212428]|uniref:Uncharacterized protein n=1 Tax=Pseudomonas brassicae TaxID=2708063 RepID=A0A6B3NPF7_9PSED|nr:hypothetical protein [Pseudomonas brassicae]NER62023.1 hypothetical protein [Pseudomonas brassicae]NER65045.1 hypothetical protein [Pseudomonas brassicae]